MRLNKEAITPKKTKQKREFHLPARRWWWLPTSLTLVYLAIAEGAMFENIKHYDFSTFIGVNVIVLLAVGWVPALIAWILTPPAIKTTSRRY